MIKWLLILVFTFGIISQAREEFMSAASDLQSAKSAHSQTLQAVKDNKVFDRQRVWEEIVFAIQEAISQGKMSVDIYCNSEQYPGFIKKLQTKGYTVTPIKTDGMDGRGFNYTISW